jgi:hypothetical protein
MSIDGHKSTLFAHLFTCVSFSVLSHSLLWFPIASRLAWVPNRGYLNSCVLSIQIDYEEVADDGNGTDDAHKVHTKHPNTGCIVRVLVRCCSCVQYVKGQKNSENR